MIRASRHGSREGCVSPKLAIIPTGSNPSSEGVPTRLIATYLGGRPPKSGREATSPPPAPSPPVSGETQRIGQSDARPRRRGSRGRGPTWEGPASSATARRAQRSPAPARRRSRPAAARPARPATAAATRDKRGALAGREVRGGRAVAGGGVGRVARRKTVCNGHIF